MDFFQAWKIRLWNSMKFQGFPWLWEPWWINVPLIAYIVKIQQVFRLHKLFTLCETGHMIRFCLSAYLSFLLNSSLRKPCLCCIYIYIHQYTCMYTSAYGLDYKYVWDVTHKWFLCTGIINTSDPKAVLNMWFGNRMYLCWVLQKASCSF